MSTKAEPFDYAKALQNVRIVLEKPAFFFRVVVTIPKDIQAKIIQARGCAKPEIPLHKGIHLIERELIETAEAWALRKVHDAYPKFWGSRGEPAAYGKRRRTTLTDTQFEVAIIYSMGVFRT